MTLLARDQRDQAPDRKKEKLLALATRSGRLGKPADITGAVVFPMPREGEWIYGQTISANGGILLR